jgi:hypothetical protein
LPGIVDSEKPLVSTVTLQMKPSDLETLALEQELSEARSAK